MRSSLIRLSIACCCFLLFSSGDVGRPSLASAQSGANRVRVLTAPPEAPAPSTVQATGRSVVKGRVVYKDTAEPLKKTRVRIFTGNQEGVVAFTNDRGEFRLGNLAAGKYYVVLEGPGIAMPSGFGMRIPLPITAIPRKEDFEEIIPRHDAQFVVDGTNTIDVEVRIDRGGSLSGKVLKANGAPVAGVPVSFITREGGAAGPYTARFSAETDKDGAYKIENLPAGEYVVAAATEDKNSNVDIRARMRGETQIVTYHPAAITINQAQLVRVDPGRETGGVNITLVARNSYGVSGTVMRQGDGAPLAGATVLLRNKESELGGSLVPGMGQRTAHTDAEGQFSFTNVMEGSYIVTALTPAQPPPSNPGEQPDREQLFRQSRQRFQVAQQEVVVAGGNLNGLVMAISGPGSIVGRVETDNAAPLPENLVIFFDLVSANNRPGPPMPVRVGPDGRFNFGNVQSGDVYLAIALPPDSKYFIRSVSANGNDPQRVPLKVEEGVEAGPLEVVISAGVGTVTGHVVADNPNQGTSDVVVLLAPVDPEKQRFRTAYLSTRTRSDGTFSVSGAPGEYLVLAKQREDLPAIVGPDFVRSVTPGATRITLAAGDQKRMDLRLQ